MMKLTRPQRLAVYRVFMRNNDGKNNSLLTIPQRRRAYRKFRRTVQPGPDCIMLPWCGMWLGIEPDGHTHS